MGMLNAGAGSQETSAAPRIKRNTQSQRTTETVQRNQATIRYGNGTPGMLQLGNDIHIWLFSLEQFSPQQLDLLRGLLDNHPQIILSRSRPCNRETGPGLKARQVCFRDTLLL